MARVWIETDDGRARIEVRQDVDTGEAVGFCEEHGEEITDRGPFEDTCEAVALHLDTQHGPRVSPVALAIAELGAMEERDRTAGGPPWEIPDHPDHDQLGSWHHGQIV